MRKEIKEFLPVGILDLIGLISIVEVLTTDYIFTYKQYIGITLLVCCSILFFVKRRIYKYFTGIVLIIGLINLIGFSTSIVTFGILGVSIQVIPFLVIFVYIYVFRDDLKRLIDKPESESELIQKRNETKDRFKNKFKNLSDKEINLKLEQDLVPEAIQALKEIKDDRK